MSCHGVQEDYTQTQDPEKKREETGAGSLIKCILMLLPRGGSHLRRSCEAIGHAEDGCHVHGAQSVSIQESVLPTTTTSRTDSSSIVRHISISDPTGS